MPKKYIFIFISPLCLFLILELLSFIFLSMGTTKYSKEEIYTYSQIKLRQEREFNYESSPFFGPVNNINSSYYSKNTNLFHRRNINNYGFSEYQNFPYLKRSDEFVIGIFGGSVAESLANQMSGSTKLKSLDAHFGKKIVILNMALSAGKQPQQYFISSYFSNTIDLAINLDGLNEITSTNYPQRPLGHPEILSGQLINNDKNLQKVYFNRLLGKIILNFGEITKNSILKHSNTLFVVYKYLVRYKEKNKNDLFGEDAISNTEGLKRWYNNRMISKKQLNSNKINHWLQYILMQKRMLSGLGKESIFILQPNLWVKNSKPFSEKELTLKEVSPFSSSIDINKSYIEMTRLIKSQNIKINNLSNIFDKTLATVYKDNCCHLNKFGNKLLIQEIINIIKNKKQE